MPKGRKTSRPTDPITDFKTLPKAESASAAGISQRNLAASPDKFQIRYNNPLVAAYVARVIIANMMDYQAAARLLVANSGVNGGRLEEYRYAEIAKLLEETPQIQDAVKADLESRKLDDRSKDAFVDRMWQWLDSGDPKKFTVAARILGKGFVTEAGGGGGKLEDLPLADLQEGIKVMLSGVLMPTGKKEAVVAEPDEPEDPDALHD